MIEVRQRLRRFIAIALTLLLAASLLAPVFAQSSQGTVMLCCRKGASHDCAGMVPGTGPLLREHCPMHSDLAVAGHGAGGLIGIQSREGHRFAVSPIKVQQVEAGFRIAFYRSRQKRGPPSTRFS